MELSMPSARHSALSSSLVPVPKSGDEIVTSVWAQLRAVFLVLVFGAGCAHAQNAPRLITTPARVLDGDSLSIRATGLPPGTRVTIHLRSTGTGDDGAP